MTVNRIIGGFRTCSGLSELSRQQVERLRDRLDATGELDASVLIASNFQRAIETAEATAPSLGGLPVDVDPGFGEHDPGPGIDGITVPAYVEKYGTPDWSGDPHVDVFPGGETTARFHLRVGEAMPEPLGRTIVVRVTVAPSTPRSGISCARRPPAHSSCRR